jgi:hypothetical protein
MLTYRCPSSSACRLSMRLDHVVYGTARMGSATDEKSGPMGDRGGVKAQAELVMVMYVARGG